MKVRFVKVAEYQLRGVVHFHAIIRLDANTEDGYAPPPLGWTAGLLADVVKLAARQASALAPIAGTGRALLLRFGPESDFADTRIVRGHQGGALTPDAVANYIAKYATKAADAPGPPSSRIRSAAEVQALRCPAHHRRMIEAAWQLGHRKWTHMLGYGGHFLTKSRRRSVTFGQLRAARAAYRRAQRYEAGQLTVREVRTWLNGLRDTCQCCAQGKDKSRAMPKCCAAGQCCRQLESERTIRDAWTVLWAALNNAVREELISRNVAALIRVPKPRRRKVKPWSADEARAFLESVRKSGDPLYAAYVLILVLGLRRGEVLGLRWEDVDFTSSELTIGWRIQRIDRQLLHRQTKTEASDARFRSCLSARSRCTIAQPPMTGTRRLPVLTGTARVWSSRPGPEGRLSRATSTEASPPPARALMSGRSRSTPPARRAPRCWSRSTFTRVWPCRCSGTARSQ